MKRTSTVLLAAWLLTLSACSDSPEEVRADYCARVTEHQRELSEIMTEETPATLLRAVPAFRSLAEAAPRDIEADWAVVLDALTGLQEALDAAGVEAGQYDADDPPAGVTSGEREAIARAADELVSEETVTAFEGVHQQARDVCKTPLYR